MGYNVAMPRNERRPIEFSLHALERMDERGVDEEEARAVVLAGAWHPDGTGRQGEPKWVAAGSVRGQQVKVAFIETTRGTLEILYVLTVMA